MSTPTNGLAGKVVIITGSVGNLGLVTARSLQAAGAKNNPAVAPTSASSTLSVSS